LLHVACKNFDMVTNNKMVPRYFQYTLGYKYNNRFLSVQNHNVVSEKFCNFATVREYKMAVYMPLSIFMQV